MPAPADFAKLVPGFDFMQGLIKNAGQALPNMNQWIAPTLDPEELDKRIEQLRAVQFWLEQNAKMLAATIQALEVQRMTLSTLKSMNMPMDGLRDAFKLKPAEPAAPAPAAKKPPRKTASAKPAATAANAAAVDPMQWWGALTQQFTELASNALKESSSEAAKAIAGQAFKAAVELPGKVVGAKLAAKKPRR
jgi:hypothetical protein